MIREGWSFVTRRPVMGPGLWAATAVNFVCGAQLALFPLYLVRELHASAGLVGVLLAAEGVGTLAGAALTTRITATLGSARSLIVAGLVAVTVLAPPALVLSPVRRPRDLADVDVWERR